MKANDVAIVVGSVRYNGFTSKVTAYDKDKIIIFKSKVVSKFFWIDVYKLEALFEQKSTFSTTPKI